MNKKFFLYIGLAVAVIAVGILLLVFFRAGTGSQNTPRISNVPAYQLSPGDEAHLRSFVKTFAELYNSYSTGDYSNLYALGDYETTAMQYRTKALIDQLDQQTPDGYDIRSEGVDASFRYSFNQANLLTASINVNVTETKAGGTGKYQSTAELSIVKDGSQYFVDNIAYTKN